MAVEVSKSRMQTVVTAHLHKLWMGLRDGGEESAVREVKVAITTLHAVGLLDDERAELWRRRLKECPGHHDGGGRRWCAYCGDIDEGEPTIV